MSNDAVDVADDPRAVFESTFSQNLLSGQLTLEELRREASRLLLTDRSILSATQLKTCRITTDDETLDNVLGGGLPTKLLVEFVGEAGTGKTQLCLQLCLTVQLPCCKKGLERSKFHFPCGFFALLG